MKQTMTPSTTPSHNKRSHKSQYLLDSANNPAKMFISLVLDMTWQLAFAVLVPIIGGFELDKHFKSSPILTILGFILAMFLMYLVLKRMMKITNDIPAVREAKH